MQRKSRGDGEDKAAKVCRDQIIHGLRCRPPLPEKERKVKSPMFILLEEMFNLETEDLGESKCVLISTGQLSHICEVFFIPTPIHRA